MAYVFGSTFVCRSIDAAKQVAFNRDIRTPSVTLEGDIFDPSGLLTGGSRKFPFGMLINKAMPLFQIVLGLGAMGVMAQNIG
ncbi:Structural maintenance of chromosomes protein 2-1 [Asimina triloba]